MNTTSTIVYNSLLSPALIVKRCPIAGLSLSLSVYSNVGNFYQEEVDVMLHMERNGAKLCARKILSSSR